VALFVLVTAVSLAVLIVWAATTEIDRVTRGAGKVVPQTQKQTVQHLEGGIVAEILVREGDTVARGQPMLRVDNSFARAELQQARLEVAAKTLRQARLAAEARGVEELTFDKALADTIPGIAEREKQMFRSRIDALRSQREILDSQIRQKSLDLQELQSRLPITRSERDLLQQRITSLERLVGIGAAARNDLLDNQRSLQQVELRLSDLVHDIPRTDSALTELRSRREDLNIRFRADAQKDAAETELQIAKLHESIAALTDRAERSEVVAPMAGVVNKLFVTTVGGVVKSGEPLVEITPADATLTVEARLAPDDRARVWPGLPAVVKVSAYEFAVYGGLPGKVLDISPDALQDERGQPYFRVRLQADSTAFGPDRPVVPGMTVDVDILSGRQTVLTALLRPLHQMQERALRE
jgi:HlyD family type I secretion membrane fusion protein